MEHSEWVKQLIGDDSLRTASAKLQLSPSAVAQQLKRGGLKPDMVIDLCRAYGRSPVDGLVETGFLSLLEAETTTTPATEALKTCTNRQILNEVLRRSDPEALELFSPPDPQVIRSNHLQVVPDPYTPRSEDGEIDWEKIPYVADSSPEELMPGDDGYGEGP